ncbi:MAG: MFS transporter [Bryobacteraceae bacterium]|nr:MAG: MFS transporter [Bryobacteraceae bacterium]
MKGWRPWIIVGVLWVAATLNYVDRQSIFAMFQPIREDLHLSDWQLGLLSTAFLWTYGIFGPLGGWLADRFSRSRVILISLCIWSVITAATGAARSFGELFAARALMGLSEAFYLPAALALIADYHNQATRSLATGIHQSGLYIGIFIGGAGAGWLGDHQGWRFTFYLLGAAGVVYAIFAAFLLRDAPRETTAGLAANYGGLVAIRGLIGSKQFLLIAAVFAVASMSYWMVYTWLPLYLLERFEMTLTSAGFSATVYIQAASFAAIVVGGWLSDRWSLRRPGARALVQAAGFATAGPFLFLTGSTDSMPLLVVALIAFGLGRGLYDCNVMPVLCDVIDPHLRATAYGILNLLGCVAGGVMAAAAGYLKSSVGLDAALQISGVLLLGCAILLMRLRPVEAARYACSQ